MKSPRAAIGTVADQAGVVIEAGWRQGNVVAKRGSKIFAIISDARFVAKLPKTRVDELVEQGLGTRFDPRKNGRVMKEWLVASTTANRRALAREAYAFAASTSKRRRPRGKAKR